MGKDAYYFSHDSNAHKDPKILKLRSKYGWEGYGIYWAIIETLREQNEYKWEANDKQLLSFCISNGEEVVNQVLATCLDVGLLVVDKGGFIHSESLTKRMKIKEEISEKRREAGKKGGTKSKRPAIAKQNNSNKSKENESKENESKENESKENESKENESKENESESEKKKTNYDEESIHYKLSLRLYQNILKNNKDHKEPNLKAWSKDIKKMVELDNRTEEQITWLIDWCQQDTFWKTIILSPAKLREKYDQLVIKAKEDIRKEDKKNRQGMPIAYQSLQEWADAE